MSGLLDGGRLWALGRIMFLLFVFGCKAYLLLGASVDDWLRGPDARGQLLDLLPLLGLGVHDPPLVRLSAEGPA